MAYTGGGGELAVFDAGRCAGGYALGVAVGRRFSDVIRSRMRQDLVLREQLLPFASTAKAAPLLAALQDSNKERYPLYWDELVGTADGSGFPLLHVCNNNAALPLLVVSSLSPPLLYQCCYTDAVVDRVDLCVCAGHAGQLQEGDTAVHTEEGGCQ
ncbi:hypothetical protein PR202_ga24210 [Eleusine coracana subsp. coracana]|uniref:Uncharacterized protein n=1 Tax=Eleusine coracana subsp. coracana TaxID=191504 RepID=A0AAV5D7T2_ELECO|nr:hypothetical protein PR202_ga24210 [Eleusine coracana subsp. coracana]